MNQHPYQPDWTLATDYRGWRPCVRCGLPKQNRIHVDHAVNEELATEEARRMGEAV